MWLPFLHTYDWQAPDAALEIEFALACPGDLVTAEADVDQ